MKRLLLGVALVAFLLFTAATSLTQVNPGQRAVVRRFGQVQPETRGPGLYVGLPWGIDRVDAVSIDTPRQITIGFDPKLAEEDEDVNPAGQFLTGDHNLVNIQAVVSYTIREDEVARYVLHKDRVDTVVAWVAESVVAEWVAAQPVEKVLLHGHRILSERLVAELPARLEPYQMGIKIERATLKPPFPPEEVRDDFEKVNQADTGIRTKVNQAEEKANAFKNEAAKEKNKIEQDAQGYARERLLEAEADAAKFTKKLEQYLAIKKTNPSYLDVLWLEEMTRLYVRMGEAGRIDLLDHFLEKGGLTILQSPLPKKK